MNEEEWMEGTGHDQTFSSERRADHEAKVDLLRKALSEKGIRSALIQSVHNFFWLTSGGRNYVSLNSDVGVASLFVDPDRLVLVTNNIEAERLVREELADLGKLQVFSKPWFWDDSAQQTRLLTLGKGSRPERDTGEVLGPILDVLRQTLTLYEVRRYRALGADCGEIIGQVARGLHRGITEGQVAGRLASACLERGIDAVVVLVAGDERMDSCRHPLPTGKTIKDRALLVICGRRSGLIASVSRVVSFNEVGSVLRQKHDAVTYVDAVAIHSTRVGATSGQVLERIQKAYAEKGFENEWQHHHQGGLTGYKSREWRAEPSSKHPVQSWQAYAWNPTISGTKSEDTILIEEGVAIPEVLTKTPGWPMIEHVIDGVVISRPDILVVESQ